MLKAAGHLAKMEVKVPKNDGSFFNFFKFFIKFLFNIFYHFSPFFTLFKTSSFLFFTFFAFYFFLLFCFIFLFLRTLFTFLFLFLRTLFTFLQFIAKSHQSLSLVRCDSTNSPNIKTIYITGESEVGQRLNLADCIAHLLH